LQEDIRGTGDFLTGSLRPPIYRSGNSAHDISCEILIYFVNASLLERSMENHRVQEMMKLMASKIRSIANTISDDDAEKFIRELLNAKRIYVVGAGRSGLVAKAFAMRLMHLGLHAYVVGETITPALNRGDVMVIFSGSGRTKTVADLAETARDIGGKICLITSNADSRIGKIADCIVIIEHHRDKVADDAAEFEIRQMMGDHKSFAPLGTLFETASMVFADAVISRMMEITKTDENALKNRHTNIE
jgi:6-phospho-3-hexuloisomerase